MPVSVIRCYIVTLTSIHIVVRVCVRSFFSFPVDCIGPLDYHEMRMTYFRYCVILFFLFVVFSFLSCFSLDLFYSLLLLFLSM